MALISIISKSIQNLFEKNSRVTYATHVTSSFMPYLFMVFKEFRRGLGLDSLSYHAPLRHRAKTKPCQDQCAPISVHFYQLVVISYSIYLWKNPPPDILRKQVYRYHPFSEF